MLHGLLPEFLAGDAAIRHFLHLLQAADYPILRSELGKDVRWARMKFLGMSESDQIFHDGISLGKDRRKFSLMPYSCVDESTADADDVILADERVMPGDFGIFDG